MALFTFQSAAPLPYKNKNLSVDERVADLLKRMTLEEKVAQLVCIWPRGRDLKPEELKHGLGQVARQQERKGPREGAAYANATQKFLVENTRLGIPAIFHDEILHGHMAQGSTSFPQPIALASSWDKRLGGGRWNDDGQHGRRNQCGRRHADSHGAQHVASFLCYAGHDTFRFF